MAEAIAIAEEALAALRRTRVDICIAAPDVAGREAKRRILEALTDTLAVWAANDGCPLPASRLLLDWRDRLGSYVLAARALDELDVHADLAEQLLVRGVDELIAEGPARITELRLEIFARS